MNRKTKGNQGQPSRAQPAFQAIEVLVCRLESRFVVFSRDVYRLMPVVGGFGAWHPAL